MLTIEGIYDGKKIEPLQEIPFKGKKKVVITFLDEKHSIFARQSEIDPIKALRGCRKGLKLNKKLIESRREDIELDKRKWRK